MVEELKQRSDEELVRACVDGDEHAWAALVMRYQRLLYSIPRRAGLDEDISADIFQQTLLKLLQNLNSITQPSQIHAWLVTTARRETLQYLRRKKTQATESMEDDETGETVEYAADGPLADEILLTMERQHRVRTAVLELDERCSQLITMLFFANEQRPYAEIADTLGISEGSIGPNRARCLEKLHKKLKAER